MAIWKILLALMVTAILLVSFPYALRYFDLIDDLRPKSFFVLLITTIGLETKLLLGNYVSSEFSYHKQGYEFCMVTLLACLSASSLQLLSADDLFPGAVKIAGTLMLGDITSNIILQRLILLFAISAVSFFLAMLTAFISHEIKEARTRAINLLSLLNFILGSGILGFYILILISKG